MVQFVSENPMKILMLLFALGLMTGCETTAPERVVNVSEKETYFAVTPTPITKTTTYHVQAEKLSPAQQSELEKALAGFEGKCWVWALPSHQQTLTANGPDHCVRFVRFTTSSPLNLYKREPTDKKMLLTGLPDEGHIQVQNFVWNGKELQRVSNSESSVGGRSFQDFMVLWALK